MQELPVEEIERLARANRASRVRVFGSRARGSARPDSDLDLLVTPGPDMSLLDLAGLKIELEQLLGIEVDLVCEGGIHPLLEDEILAEARPLHAS